jgi:ADP-ribose pyrophosphatase YjhB (NUDIX family)
MQNRHLTQTQILRNLLFAESLKYSEMKPNNEMPNNEFQFHLDKLISEKLVEKREKGYSLTYKGKEVAGRIDTDKLQTTKQSKISVRLIGIQSKKNEKEYLFYTRLKQPFYGKQGFPAGKVQYGETYKDAAAREFNEETGLEGKPKLFLIEHWLTFNKEDNTLLDDKVFFNYIIEEPTGKLNGNNEGEYTWIKESDINQLIQNPFDDINYIRELLKRSEISGVEFVEKSHFTSDF